MFDNIKIAFFDLDGTLTNSDKLITEKTIEALKTLRNKGIKIVFSSGRWDSYILNLDNNLNIVDYLICNNGAEVLDAKNKVIIKEDSLTKDIIDDIQNYCLVNNIDLIFNGFFNQFNGSEEIKTNVYQTIISCHKLNEVDKIIDYVKDKDFKISYISSDYYRKIENSNYSINFNLITTDKGDSIRYLLNYLNIDKKDSICFGDNDNDLGMFDSCGYKVAMENALQDLKDKANFITLSNDKDGVAYFINEYMK